MFLFYTSGVEFLLKKFLLNFIGKKKDLNWILNEFFKSI